MKNLKELEKKYEELGKEIEKLKKEKEQENDIPKDHIFLLSIDEYKKYKNKIPLINTWWWLRSPGFGSDCVTFVNYFGLVNRRGNNVNDDSVSIRPVLRIDAEKWFFKNNDKSRIIFCGVTWIQIDNGLYISEVPISFEQFDKESNDYATSGIRKFLLDWYEERKDY